MLGNLAALAIASLFSVGSYAYSVAVPTTSDVASPLPLHKPLPTATPTPTLIPTATPTPTLIPTATPTPQPIASPGDLESYFERFAGEYSVDKELLKKIANCESHFNSNAENGDYQGMFQFAASSWVGTRQAMGADTNIDLRKNAEEAIKTAAFKISHGGVGAWPSCSR